MTWSYLPHTAEDRQEMLAAIGVKDTMDLFCDIPEQIRLHRSLNLPGPLSEPELTKYFQKLAAANANLQEYACFLGAGAYDHYIPSTVDHVLRRSEFYTAYTQYQPEISQGYLQALWEYQSMICEITGMPVANASMYDGATAMAEAAILACHATNRKEILVARSVNPNYREVLMTYARDFDFEVKEIDFVDGITSNEKLKTFTSKATAAVIVQNPNFFGNIEDLASLIEIAHTAGALFVTVADPTALGILEAPGKLGADLVVGEGQPLGLAISFGGPYLGFFAASTKLMRKMPGRIVGQTVDKDGKRGFVLTLQAREQHIRREKATSNICSNEALCALAISVYLATMGKEGYAETADQCLQKAHYAYNEILKTAAAKPAFGAPFFQEFVVKVNKPIAEINKNLLDKKIIGGLDLGEYYPELSGHMLICVTEKRTKAEIDALVAGLEALK
ncbi:MAG: aminomethyl-transferring glycine dehydrogenase subunit GcvPA [Acidaminococcaceae bacterium]